MAKTKDSTTASNFQAHFAFCSGIENSYPIITDHRGQSLRRDGMELSEHYKHWKHDLKLVSEFGLRYLRYGPPFYKCHLAPDRYDWSFPDKTFAELKRLRITPITDLCHFGVPDWMGGGFQNPDWPRLFAQYAGAFAKRFPWVRLYTPVNEIMIAAQFSTLNGWWNERLTDDRAFVTAIKHLCQANLLAQEAILKVQPSALFIQSESSTYFHPAVPAARQFADFQNNRRFLSLDLCYGHPVEAGVLEYLIDHGLTRDEYHWFNKHAAPIRHHCIMGTDYYITNEKRVNDAKGTVQGSGEVLGYYEITIQYYQRYRLPVFYTETNLKDDAGAPGWLWKEFFNVLHLREDGVPVVGFTWFSFFDQTDWDVELREDNYRINPMGLYDLQRKIRPVGKIYRQLISDWRNELPQFERYRPLEGFGTSKRKSTRSSKSAEIGKKLAVHQEHAPAPKKRASSKAEG